jgi:rhamnogalacturonan endolyase
MRHRQFTRSRLWALGATAAVTMGVLTVANLASPAGAATETVSVTNSATAITISNPGLLFSIRKSNGNMTSLKLAGRELLGNGGTGYVTTNGDPYGFYSLGGDTANMSYAVRTGADFADAVVTHKASSTVPITIAQHYILRAGERGVHMFTEVAHPASSPAAAIGELRFVLRGDPKIFNTHSIEDNISGVMPDQSKLDSAPAVQDATYDLQGLNSGYPKRYYTKYDWSALNKDHLVHGFYGNNTGLWMTYAQKDTLTGGPTRYDLAVHAGGTPILLNMMISGHYGSKTPTIGTAAFSKTFGPFFLYANTGAGMSTLRADATAHAYPTFDRTWYDRLGIPGYQASTQRGTVNGTVKLADGTSMAGAVAVLDTNGVDFQRAANGYQYWADVAADGSFTLPRVRTGVYRLTVYKNGIYGEYHLDGVRVDARSTVNLPAATWTPPTAGTTLWQIGTFDRSAAEFRHGNEYRNYWGTWDYRTEFPNGVRYVVGTSDPAKDFNYAQWRTFAGTTVADWDIQFNLTSTQLATAGDATLTIALAASKYESVIAYVNGTAHALTFGVSDDDNSSCAVRSGISCFYLGTQLRFSKSWLKAGTNHLTLHLPVGTTPIIAGKESNAYVQYDAIRLEA